MSAAEEPRWGPREDLSLLNTPIRRLDGPDKVTGRARYSHDVRLPNMVYARLLVHPGARGTLVSIDVAPALEVPGVVHAEALKEAGEVIRFSGTDGALAVVAAETVEALEDGLRAVEAVVEPDADQVVTREQALADGAPVVNTRRRAESNVSGERERGDREATEEALGSADAVVERTYELPVQHHVCLETHGQVVDFDGTSATVHASSQMVSALPGAFARSLEVEASDVRVLTPHMGGGFGSKFGDGIEGRVASRVARALERPVHLLLTRPHEFQLAGNRSGSWQRLRGGAKADGTLVALAAEADRLGGTGGGALPTPPYIYGVETSWARVRSVHTATDSSRAMRAPGHPQASFAMESLVDELAYAIGMDPVEFRKKNLDDPVWHRQLDRVAAEIGWSDHPNRTTPGEPDASGVAVGIGFGVSQWSSGARPGARCEVRVHPDGSVESRTATQDLGTGSRTYVAAIPAEELGLRIDQVTPFVGDSALPPNVASGGSVTTGSSAPAIKAAAHDAREKLEALVADALGAGAVGGFVWRDGAVHVEGDEGKRMTWAEVCGLLGEPLVGSGEFVPELHEGSIHGAQAARVEVDTLTGRVRVVKMVCMQDQGLPLNRLALRSQINGGMVQALSYGLLERRVLDPDEGHLLTDNLDVYRIAGCREIGEMVAIIDDEDERPTTCGMAEATVVPGHAAIANAIFNACGARLTHMPFTPDNVLTAIHGAI